MSLIVTIAGLVPSISAGYLLTQLVNGLMLGLVFVLVALGLSLIFGIMSIVNFAHGALLMIGAYVAWTVLTATGSFVLAVIAAPIAVAILGMAIERVTLRPIYQYDILMQLLLTFGLAIFLREAVMMIWGRQGKSFPIPAWANGSVDFGLFTYPEYRLFLIGIVPVLIGIVYLFLTRTDFGLVIRAGANNREMVDTLGIDISKVFMVVFGLGAALAGIAGALIAPIQSVYPTLGVNFLLPAFVVVIVGGLGSFRGSIVGGLLIGEAMALTGLFYSELSNIIIFVLAAVVMLVRPRGLFGEEVALE